MYLLIILAFFCGWWMRDIRDSLKLLRQHLDELKTPVKEKPEDKPKASFAEPLDPLQFAAQQEQERIKVLNE